MRYRSLKETYYSGHRSPKIVLVSPHGADASDFLAAFPEIEADRQMQALWPLFMTYLGIERDVGADELGHAIAHSLARQYDLSCHVIEINYPRGIVDGGRLMDHCLRSCLPTALFMHLKQEFFALHRATLVHMETIYRELKSRPGSMMIDVHTMASFCPVDGNGERYILPVSFHRLEDYVTQFLEARNHSYRRSLDLITADDQGRLLADPDLLRHVEQAFQRQGYPYLQNNPYCAAPAYLSHQHMQRVPGLSLDVPKHLLSSWAPDFTDYQLDEVPLDAQKIEALASCVAGAIHQAVTEKLGE